MTITDTRSGAQSARWTAVDQDGTYGLDNSDRTVDRTYVEESGRPANWSDQLPSWNDSHRSLVRKGRNRKGASSDMVLRHGSWMVDVDGTRMTDHAVANWATQWARNACDDCTTMRATCEHREDDKTADDDFCDECVDGCGCMPKVEGGMTVAYAEVVEFDPESETVTTASGAEIILYGSDGRCDVAHRHSDLLDAFGSLANGLDRETYAATAHNTTESKLSWPTRRKVGRMPALRNGETCETITVDQVTITEVQAAAVDPATIWLGHRLVTRPLNARQQAEQDAQAARDARAADTARLTMIYDVTALAVGEVWENGPARITRNPSGYNVTIGTTRTRARTLIGALRAVDSHQ